MAAKLTATPHGDRRPSTRAAGLEDAAARGQRLSQRALARQLRSSGHRFPNQDLYQIAVAVGLATGTAA